MAEATSKPASNLAGPEPDLRPAGTGGGPAGPGDTTAMATGGGFFRIYKSGQGYWTRLITCLAAAVLLAIIAHWVFTHSRIWLTEGLTTDTRPVAEARSLAQQVAFAIAAAIFFGGGLIGWRVVNSPRVADFLITTDSEMKKVNWATRKEVVGSTRVVILFVFFVATFLFVSDVVFSWFFHLIKVLKASPFG